MSTAIPPWEVPSTGAAAALAAAMRAVLPVLETPRLRLRPAEIGDFAPFAEIEAVRSGADRRESWLSFCDMVASWPLRGFGPFAITAREGGAWLGLLPIDHETGDPEREIGWFLAPAARGQGIATEAARAALAHLFGPLALPSIVSFVDDANRPSWRVSERLGGVREADILAEDGARIRVYRHRKEHLA